MALFKPLLGTRSNLPTTKTDGYAYFCTDDGTFWIDYKDDQGVVQRKQINAKDAETLMGASLATTLEPSNVEIPTSAAVLNELDTRIKNPDWDETDETSPSYIQNKTHWSKTTNIKYTNDALAFESDPIDDGRTLYVAFAETSMFSSLSENDVVIVTFDGNIYTYTVPTGSSEGLVAGNLTIFNSSATDTGEPFVLSLTFSQGFEIYTLETDATHSITISSTVENVHQLDAKYLPDDDTAPYPLKTNVYTKDEVNSEINASKEIETAIYGTTTFAQLTEWLNVGKIIQVVKDGYIYQATRKTDTYIYFELTAVDSTQIKYLYCSSENKWWGTSIALVSTHTNQTITGNKTFYKTLILKSDGDYKFYLCVGDDGSLSTSMDLNNFRRHVMVSDIVDNLTTNVSNKPLSAAQGVALKDLIDAIVVPTKVSELTNDSGYLTSFTETDPTVPAWAKAASKPTYTASEVGLGNVGNFKAVSTVASQGLTDTEKSNARANIGAGTSSLTIGTTASTAAAGNHTHTAANVGAVPTSRTVNGKALSANITLAASDVGAATMTEVNSAIQTAIGNAIGGSY